MELNERKATLIRNYSVEVMVMLLCTAVVFLTAWIYKLDGKTDAMNAEIKSYMRNDNAQVIQLVTETKDLLKQNIEALKYNSEVLIKKSK